MVAAVAAVQFFMERDHPRGPGRTLVRWHVQALSRSRRSSNEGKQQGMRPPGQPHPGARRPEGIGQEEHSPPVGRLLAGLTAGLALLAASPRFRQVIDGVPTRGLIGLHAVRIGGFVWLALLDMHLLPPAFGLSAGYGDMAVGASALIVVHLLTANHPRARAFVIGWNVLGLVDFALAVTTAFASMAPFVEQMARSGASLSYLNYPFLIPSFGVPVFGLLHVFSLFQLRSAARRSPTAQLDTLRSVPASQSSA